MKLSKYVYFSDHAAGYIGDGLTSALVHDAILLLLEASEAVSPGGRLTRDHIQNTVSLHRKY